MSKMIQLTVYDTSDYVLWVRAQDIKRVCLYTFTAKVNAGHWWWPKMKVKTWYEVEVKMVDGNQLHVASFPEQNRNVAVKTALRIVRIVNE